jgi:hypothetical protein
LAIISFIKNILRIRESRIILQPRDAQIDSKEAQELAELIRTLNPEYKVDAVTSPEQRGRGVVPIEILYVWLITGSTIFVGKLIEKLAEEIAKIAVQWARDRFRKKGRAFPTSINIYGPNGKILKSVFLKDATQEAEDHTKANRKDKMMKRKPPLLEE